jgi:hypothetical protein
MNDDTIIVTAGLRKDVYQVHAFGELQEFYDSDPDEPEADVIPIDFDNWHMRHMLYGFSKMTEATLPLEEQRPDSMLARMALCATDLQAA